MWLSDLLTLLHRQKGESANAPLIYSASPLQGQNFNPQHLKEFHSILRKIQPLPSLVPVGTKTVNSTHSIGLGLNHSTGSCIKLAQSWILVACRIYRYTQISQNRLGAPQNRVNFPVSSLDGNKTIVKSELNATIINGNGSFSTTLDFLVVSKITDFLPVSQINLNNLKIYTSGD
ncbi:hypothetical protein TNIN_447071 [Trichonephila inaurata madagascariensis]|uniref:Uncharacterized protein n=1 Tax=Trichonephila inaurata madagascariensis TaxID=2747483 RepID=A0A8X6XU07_9ARAC|nr:hypothetical protein TNIN_447071 [Trichonephila inaurata madagascariensis]